MWVGEVKDGDETGFSNNVRRAVQGADLDEDGLPVRRWHCVLQGRAFMRQKVFTSLMSEAF
jgi:hypothetical protein